MRSRRHLPSKNRWARRRKLFLRKLQNLSLLRRWIWNDYGLLHGRRKQEWESSKSDSRMIMLMLVWWCCWLRSIMMRSAIFWCPMGRMKMKCNQHLLCIPQSDTPASVAVDYLPFCFHLVWFTCLHLQAFRFFFMSFPFYSFFWLSIFVVHQFILLPSFHLSFSSFLFILFSLPFFLLSYLHLFFILDIHFVLNKNNLYISLITCI